MNKQQLASKIWDIANNLRGKIEASEYKDYILGFIFYKYLSDNEWSFLEANGFKEEDSDALTEDNPSYSEPIKNSIGYFIEYKNLFSSWIKAGSDFQVADVTLALNAFSRNIGNQYKELFSGILDGLSAGILKLGTNDQQRTANIRKLIEIINDIPTNSKDYDILGFIYEYLIGMFAANAGKKAGEFYTPHEVSVLMSEIISYHLRDRKTIEIYDPTSGSGSLLINIGKSASAYLEDPDRIKYYAQELIESTYNLTKMNLLMRGIKPYNVCTRNADTLEDDWPPSKDNKPFRLDAVVSNPPYSQKWDPKGKDGDPRYRFGLAPKSKADYAFVLHDLYHLKPDGIMTIVLPHGVLFRGGTEGEIREKLIENNHIDAIIGLPANIFFGTGIPTIIMILKQERPNDDILFIDASKGFIKVGKSNKLRSCDIKKIVATYIGRTNIEKYSKVVSKDEIRSNDYNLNIPRYVDSSEDSEKWDLYSTMLGGISAEDVNAFNKYWEVFPSLKNSLFVKDGERYKIVEDENLKDTIFKHPNVKSYKDSFVEAFKSLKGYLRKGIIDNWENINVNRNKNHFIEDIFTRLESIPLIDKYEAYQIFDDQWQIISQDIEVMQSEGFDVTKQVDPNIVLKKKDGKEVEKQEGWLGRILPFDIVQASLLGNESLEIESLNNKMSELESSITEIIESLDEENKTVLNEDNDAFDKKAFGEKIKDIQKEKKNGTKFSEDSVETSLLKADAMLKDLADVKKQIKTKSEALHLKTKETIESLTGEQVFDLLYEKWISPIVEKFNDLPNSIINELSSKIKSLKDKYNESFSDINKDITQTENELFALLSELEGDKFDTAGIDELKRILEGE